jgi:hypothetical protein
MCGKSLIASLTNVAIQRKVARAQSWILAARAAINNNAARRVMRFAL